MAMSLRGFNLPNIASIANNRILKPIELQIRIEAIQGYKRNI